MGAPHSGFSKGRVIVNPPAAVFPAVPPAARELRDLQRVPKWGDLIWAPLTFLCPSCPVQWGGCQFVENVREKVKCLPYHPAQ